jgi:hypothetical protein
MSARPIERAAHLAAFAAIVGATLPACAQVAPADSAPASAAVQSVVTIANANVDDRRDATVAKTVVTRGDSALRRHQHYS